MLGNSGCYLIGTAVTGLGRYVEMPSPFSTWWKMLVYKLQDFFDYQKRAKRASGIPVVRE